MSKYMKYMLIGMVLISFSNHGVQTPDERSLSTALTAAAAMVNKSAPQMLDEETRLDSAATFRNFIIYNNTMVNYSAEQLDITLFDPLIQESVIAPLCSNEKLSGFIELGVVMVYRYLGKNGAFITELSKDMATCNEAK
ncbi:hypothetical protein FX988_04063 [Paraglaciecola mesophila]|uniref:Rap1a immunity protein domain-containing protein n=2 Tax=Paraglaciecola mesophila TaxID=197222 RepID=A0A857JPL5_9ALTE|nr:hypothetical protein FX988_04063 [Paraglaciecola mesophila]